MESTIYQKPLNTQIKDYFFSFKNQYVFENGKFFTDFAKIHGVKKKYGIFVKRKFIKEIVSFGKSFLKFFSIKQFFSELVKC